MKQFKKNSVITILAIAFIFGLTGSAAALGNTNNEINDQADLYRNQNTLEEAADRQATSSEIKENTTSTKARTDYALTTANLQGKLMSETHRSAVAAFVQSLLNVADREGGIGDQVREIAKSQNDSATTTVSAIAKVEKRSSIKTFFFGSDYKNLGVIRSELATTSNNVARLKLLLNQTTNDADRTELNAQIQALEAEQAQVKAYVTARESTFSLFGWLVKYL